MIKSGNYLYSPQPDAGSSPDRVTSGLVSTANGVLVDGLSNYAGWMGSGTALTTVRVVFDLLRDYPLEQINIVMNSQNIYWGFKDITVKYRPEAKLGYYIAARHVRSGTNLNYTVTVPMANATARYVILEIRRTQQYQHIPLTEVEFYKGTGEAREISTDALTATDLKAELSKDALMVDKYGQWISETWPGKVGYDVQLQFEYANEATQLATTALNLAKYDAYGGIKSMGKYAATGFFRLQKNRRQMVVHHARWLSVYHERRRCGKSVGGRLQDAGQQSRREPEDCVRRAAGQELVCSGLYQRYQRPVRELRRRQRHEKIRRQLRGEMGRHHQEAVDRLGL
ncbi:hypothetical protein [Cohnella rhizosphaerae]|uniref:Uncharacterized protein n=1 Tax=Cohnella rhizosphaerae TaxID=1457232 RepID=A0A9X4KXQ1_9BACL|nr:hypothetical protein [Cohnella rhizosphaerae]MDG0812673.1 hypothetical protein [Cohnella rhizosphaerae]